MHVRKASFLKFNGVDACNRDTQSILINVPQERVHLQLEDPGDQVMPVSSCLSRQELPLDFWPFRVGCGSDEQICSTIEPVDGQSILATLNHVALATCEG